MSRYYFHLHGADVALDETGSELPDESAAREWAKLEVRFHAAQSIKEHAALALDHKIVIEKEGGEEVAAIAFGDVLSVSR